MYPNTAANSPEENEWARIEHIAENVFAFSEICSESGSDGTSSTRAPYARDAVDNTRSINPYVDRDASFDAFSSLEWSTTTNESRDVQEDKRLLAAVMVRSSMEH